MFVNYLIVAIRNLKKQKFYTLINIMGLSIGLTCFLLIMLFVSHEISYDQHHSDANRIYRIDFSGTINGNEFVTALMCAPGAAAMKADYPEVADAFRFRTTGNWFVKRKGEQTTFKEEKVINADPNFFTFWDIPLLYGDPETCLSRPRTLVMDRTTATKIFGETNPVGEMVILDNHLNYEVTGVYEDFPDNSHFQHNILLTMLDREDAESPVWMSFNFNTYLKLDPKASPLALEAKFPQLIETKMGPEIQKYMNMSLEDFSNLGNKAGLSLIPLTDIHLYSNKLGDLSGNGDIKYVYIFTAIALFILLLACINFMNLATARSANRAKEVGIRKVLGAIRPQLIRQFLSEAILLSFLSTVLAVGLVYLLLPAFNELSGKMLAFNDLLSPTFGITAAAIFIIVGILAGSYPAFYLSAFQPAQTLKGKLTLGLKSGGIRSTLVVLQFTVSIMMIVGTAIVFDQLDYIQNKKLGFDKEQILMIHDAWILDKKVKSYKEEALRDARIERGTISGFLPVNTSNNNNIYFPGKTVSGDESHVINNHWVDHDYLATLGLKMKTGRWFSRDFPSDSTAVILNEVAARQMGFNEDITGKYVSTYAGNNFDSVQIASYKIIGIVEDFHYKTLREHIEPLVMHLGENTGYIAFKVAATNPAATIDYLRTLWDEFAPGQPFAYSFLDQRFNNLYKAEQQIGKIFGVFAFLAIFIACLGLFGLAAFTAEQRKKEIGIRKVMGASVSHIVNKLSWNFIRLVGLSFFIATPLAYLAMSRWLEDFEYRTQIHWWVFVVAGLTAAAIAWLTMGVQSWKAARANPVNSLRNE